MWAVYALQEGPETLDEFAIMSVNHKASIQEEAGGFTWFARACNTDREAVILMNAEDAALALQEQCHLRRPRKPRAPPLYCYIGGGIDKQPECITGIVVRTRHRGLTAAVVTACRILGLSFPGGNAEVMTDLIEADDVADWAEEAVAGLKARINSMWMPWRTQRWPGPYSMLQRIFDRLLRPTDPLLPPSADPSAVLQIIALPEDEDDGDDGGEPCGGIDPSASLRTTFSQTAASAPG